MTYLLAGAAVGMFAGWFSYRHQKLFLAGFAAIGGGIMLSFKFLLKMLFGVSVGTDAGVSGAFGSMPVEAQNAVWVCLMAALATRIVVWAYYSFVHEEKVETRAEQRARILAEYGMADPLA